MTRIEWVQSLVLAFVIIGAPLGIASYWAPVCVHYPSDQVRNDVQTVSMLLKRYEAMTGFLPTIEQGLEALVVKPTTHPAPARWTAMLGSVPIDPWGEPDRYRSSATSYSAGFELVSYGPDRKPGTADDIRNR